MSTPLIKAVLGVLLPPLAVFFDKGLSNDFWINLLLTILLPLIGGILHAFHTFGVEPVTNLLCIFLPPVAVFLKRGIGMDFLISLVLLCVFWLPGAIFAYYVCLDGSRVDYIAAA